MKKDNRNQSTTHNKQDIICPWCYRNAYRPTNMAKALTAEGDNGKDLICPHCKKEFRVYRNYGTVFNTNRLIPREKGGPIEAWVWGEQPKDE